MRGKYENFPYAVWPRTCMNVCMVFSFSRFHLFTTPWTVAHQVPLSMDSPGKNTGVGCHDFLQGIFPTQGLNLCLLWLLHRRQILYQGSYLGSPTYIAKYYYQHPLLKWCICCNWWTKWTQSHHSKSVRDQTLISSICSTFFTTAPSEKFQIIQYIALLDSFT